jgi:hypothetical protein
MNASVFVLHAGACVLLLAASGCERDRTTTAAGVLQTKFPGQLSAGGGTSGQVLARSAKPVAPAATAGGTPGIAGGAGGSTGGAATAGTVQESGHGPSSGTSQPASSGTGQPASSGPSGGTPPVETGKPPSAAPGR